MSVVIILPREWELLAKRRLSMVSDHEPLMHSVDSDVFHYCCSKMDWRTGEIGTRSALSYARIALELSEDIPRKSSRTLRTVTRKAVENSVNRLVKAGLLLREPVSGLQHKRLLLTRVFWLELLTAPDSANNPDGRQLGAILNTLFENKDNNNSNLYDNCACSWESKSAPDGTYSNNYLSNAREADCLDSATIPASPRVSMTLDWQPDRQFVDDFLRVSGFSGKHIKKIWFGSYVQYWSLQTERKTQHEWTVHFAKHMQGYLLQPGRFERLNGLV